MYKIIVDISTKDLFIALIKDDECIDYIIKEDLIKKNWCPSNFIFWHN